jgi:hypothetical protein
MPCGDLCHCEIAPAPTPDLIELDPRNWQKRGSSWVYRDRTGAHGGVVRVVLKPGKRRGRLQIDAKGSGFLWELPGKVDHTEIELRIGDTRYCVEAGSNLVADGSRGRLLARNIPAPASCAAASAADGKGKGILWLLGDENLVAPNGDEPNWVPEIFAQIIADASPTIGPILKVHILYTVADSDIFPKIVAAFESVAENASLTGAKSAFETASADGGIDVIYSAATVENMPVSSGDRSAAPAPPSIDYDILVLADGATATYLDMPQADQDAIVAHVEAGGVLVAQGRSASLLGSVVLRETNSVMDNLSPAEALTNPYDKGLQLEPGMFGMLPKSIIDANLLDTGRIARLPVVLARANQDFDQDLLAIGIDDATALRIKLSETTDDGYAEVRGGGSVTLQHARACGTEVDLEPIMIGNVEYTTPHITRLVHHQLIEGYEFEVTSKQITVRPDWEWVPEPFAQEDAVNFTQNLTLSGGSTSPADQGSVYFKDVFLGSKNKALMLGEVEFTNGLDILQNTVYGTRLFSGNGGGQATKVGVNLLALAEQPGRTALMFPMGSSAKTLGKSVVKNVGFGTRSVLALDSYGVSGVAYSDYEEKDSSGPRQSVALVGANLSVIGKNRSVDLHDFPACDSMLAGDVNCDSKVNVVDVQAVINNSLSGEYDTVEPIGSYGDVNCDGKVNAADVTLAIQLALAAM